MSTFHDRLSSPTLPSTLRLCEESHNKACTAIAVTTIAKVEPPRPVIKEPAALEAFPAKSMHGH